MNEELISILLDKAISVLSDKGINISRDNFHIPNNNSKESSMTKEEFIKHLMAALNAQYKGVISDEEKIKIMVNDTVNEALSDYNTKYEASHPSLINMINNALKNNIVK